MFVGKARSLQCLEQLKATGLLYILASLITRLSKVKHASLSQTFVNYGREKVCTLDDALTKCQKNQTSQ